MKITIWTAATDGDGGTLSSPFATEMEAQNHVLEFFDETREAFEEWLKDDTATPSEWYDKDLYGYLENKKDYLDTFSIEKHELEIPDGG